MAKDYYEILGVSRTATKQEIGKAYRALAKKYHPDLHPDDKEASQKFQEVQQAFDVLNNDEKRKQYDQFGPDFENMGAGFNPGGFRPGGGRKTRRTWSSPGGGGGAQWEFDVENLGDIFQSFQGGFGGGGFNGGFGGGNPTGAQGGARRRRASVKGNDLQYPITILFQESILGTERDVRIQSSSGDVKTIVAKIPPGIEDGKKLRLRGLGESSTSGGPAGDLVLEIHVEPHPVFSRQGDDLIMRLPVTIAEAALGAKVPIPTPKGEGVLNIPPGTSSGKKLRIRGAGVPGKNASGDLLVEILINVPKSIDENQAQVLRELDKNYFGDLRSGISW
ncbi:MAG: J domain-containing protein [Planctomycetia bacterium]|nr:J domain-containing protein [Planctomycetia bacterium]